jgi:ABC-type sugar transport system substrate-binding protein
VSAVALGTATFLLAACGSSSSGSTAAGSTAASSAGPASSAGESSAAGTSPSAASPAAAGNLPKTLVFSPLSLAPPALKGLSEGVKGYAGQKGWEVIVQDPNFDPTKQTQQLNEVIDSGRAGAAWVIANAPSSMGPVIKAAQGKGVPILVNGRPDEYGYSGPQPGVTFDYIDYGAAGKALGQQLGACLTSKTGGKGKVLFSASIAGQAGKKEFDEAATAALKAAAPGATLVQTITVSDRAKGQTAIGNVLQGNPDLVGVMASTDEGSLGALGAAAAAGKTLACTVDFGGNDEVLKDVKAGKIYASVALQFGADMAQSFDTLAKMQADPTAAGQVLTVPQKIVTAAG